MGWKGNVRSGCYWLIPLCLADAVGFCNIVTPEMDHLREFEASSRTQLDH
jgi:hypothetical protein